MVLVTVITLRFFYMQYSQLGKYSSHRNMISYEGSKLSQAATYQKDIIRILVLMRDYAKLSLEDICIGLKKDRIWKVYIVYDLTEKLCSASSLIFVTTDFFLMKNSPTANIGSLRTKCISNVLHIWKWIFPFPC